MASEAALLIVLVKWRKKKKEERLPPFPGNNLPASLNLTQRVLGSRRRGDLRVYQVQL